LSEVELKGVVLPRDLRIEGQQFGAGCSPEAIDHLDAGALYEMPDLQSPPARLAGAIQRVIVDFAARLLEQRTQPPGCCEQSSNVGANVRVASRHRRSGIDKRLGAPCPAGRGADGAVPKAWTLEVEIDGAHEILGIHYHVLERNGRRDRVGEGRGAPVRRLDADTSAS
jgi:hypothetical protein